MKVFNESYLLDVHLIPNCDERICALFLLILNSTHMHVIMLHAFTFSSRYLLFHRIIRMMIGEFRFPIKIIVCLVQHIKFLGAIHKC